MTEPAKQAISWQADFSTGVPIIDDQHRVLINMLNDANTKLDDYSPLKDYEHIVQGLLNYTVYHFQTEDNLMKQRGYEASHAAVADRHRLQHKELAEKVVAVHEQIKAGQRITKASLVSFLFNWLADHILHTDKELGTFLCDAQARPAGNTN